MLQMAPKYEFLTLLQKVEVLSHALDNTTGADLAKVLWFKSRNSEMWLYRRTNYTRSLAVMSMVGYVLGLGDRHPSNLALHRRSGKILHIDFGDWCVWAQRACAQAPAPSFPALLVAARAQGRESGGRGRGRGSLGCPCAVPLQFTSPCFACSPARAACCPRCACTAASFAYVRVPPSYPLLAFALWRRGMSVFVCVCSVFFVR
jgi:hypothetical protein